MQPPTPDLAGSPTLYDHSPEKSYIPQDFIRLIEAFTYLFYKISTPVMGFVPPLAIVAAMIAIFQAVTSREQS
jgi:hypothetical protein